MTQQTESHPAMRLFDLLINQIRDVIRIEITTLRHQTDGTAHKRQIAEKPQRFYTLKQAAIELNLSPVSVRRLIRRGLLRPSRATRHIRIAKEEIDQFARSTV